MDKLKPHLEVLKKYHFWILCVVILGASFFAWRSGTKTLAEQFENNKSQIAGAFSQAEGVNHTNPHPTQRFIEEKQTAHDSLLAELEAAWKLHYDRQKEVLIWPSSPPLLPDFAEKVSALGPTDEIPDLYKSDYKENARKIPATWIAKYNLRHAVGGEGRETQFEGALVWNELPKLEQRYTFAADPTTKQIRIAQEDFWMYEIVLAAVAKLNEGRAHHHEAIVKQIVTLNIAQAAQVAPPVSIPTTPPGKDLSKDIKPPAADAPDADLTVNRYSDPTGKPLPAPTGQEEYVLMPVQLVVIMDQRRIPDLLLSLANAPLLFDTNLLLYTDGDLAVDPAAAAKPAGGGNAGGGGQGGRGQGGGNSAAAAAPVEMGPYDARVEIRGNMFLFNPPDPKVFTPKGAPRGPDVAAAP